MRCRGLLLCREILVVQHTLSLFHLVCSIFWGAENDSISIAIRIIHLPDRNQSVPFTMMCMVIAAFSMANTPFELSFNESLAFIFISNVSPAI